jgi:hypothetical protein
MAADMDFQTARAAIGPVGEGQRIMAAEIAE